MATVGIGIATSGPAHADHQDTGPTPLDYVALGDSAAAGPLIPDQDPNIACLRSDRNYPRVAAEALGADLTDVTCSGARLSDFSGRQFGFLPPQYSVLDEDTDLVSLTIGGNDVDLVSAALSCVNLLREPHGDSCEERFTQDGADRIAEDIEAWEPELDRALTEIRDRAPDAVIVVAGYGTYVREGGCWPVQPVWGRDADYIQGSVDLLNEALERQALAHGGTYVDLAEVSVGHDVCAPPSERYLEGLVPTSVAAPLHPNARGMAAFGEALAEAVGAPARPEESL
ncbi:SGNH/GDSL hydrolase family protein [Nocardiopsis ganjiahuensis]|uniref:SGNH/GDSL hydrolase family protein n=1 Tax=Nocardiopsis ganjiahuensis TaxID=239984 RepID=UPI00034DD3AB|nr:SGNH/GDSL hydrolase family protein [Nocardiopsis ganjiahuensis]